MSDDPSLHFVHDFFIPAEPAQAFAACTEAESLQRWFAERAEIEPRVGGAYRFWGRYTPAGVAPELAGQRILAIEAGRSLRFSWTWAGVPGEVQMDFAAGAEPSWGCDTKGQEKRMGCSLKLSHRLAQPLPFPRPEQFVDDFWRVSMGNLAGHLQGEGNVVLVDHDDPEPEVRLSIEIEASPAEVFRALTEPELLNQWLAKTASIEPRVGGGLDLGWGGAGEAPPMRILEFEAERRLSFSWPDWRGTEGVPDQQVCFELEPCAAGTRVQLRHTGFVRPVDRSDFQQGWPSFLAGLRQTAQALS